MKIKSLLLVAALLCSAGASAQEVAATAEPKAQSETAELICMAGKLVKYGYQTKTALPLIQAVEIYNRVGLSDEADAKAKESQNDGVVEAPKGDKPAAVTFDPAKLLADATTYAEGDKNLLALIQEAGGTRGRTVGPTRHYDDVLAGHTDIYTMTFRGGEEAIVVVSGDGDTDLDLYVYDENGNFIGSDVDGTDDCVVSFTPRWTGKFKIKIKNLGRVYNHYLLATN